MRKSRQNGVELLFESFPDFFRLGRAGVGENTIFQAIADQSANPFSRGRTAE